MGVLRNAKHEKVVNGIIKGLSPCESYAKVYGKAPGNSACATRLVKTAKVAQRIVELKNQAAEVVKSKAVGMAVTNLRERETRIEWLADLATRQRNTILARARLYATAKGAGGVDVEVAGGDQGMVVPTYVAGGRIAFQFDGSVCREHLKTLQQIAQEAGDWTEKVIHSGGITVKRLIGVSLDEF